MPAREGEIYQMAAGKILVGKKAISIFVGRSWGTVKRWIREEDFPAKKIDGGWHSDADLVHEWLKGKITEKQA